MARISIVALLCMALANFAVAQTPPTDSLRAGFEKPPVSSRPMIRWWWPGAAVDQSELTREIGALDAAGFGGAEIQPFIANVPLEKPNLSARVNDYPSLGFFNAVAGAAQAAHARGLKLDYTFGSGWPTGGEAITPKLAALELTMAYVTVQGPVRGPIVLPDVPRTPRIGAMMENTPDAPKLDLQAKAALAQRSRIVAIVAVRGTTPATTPYRELSPLTGAAWPSVTQPGLLDSGSAIVLTDRLTADGRLNWRAPKGRWQILVFKQYPADIRVLGGVGRSPGLVADHFSARAFDAHAASIGAPMLARLDADGRAGLKSIFIDSLELPADLFWSDDFLPEFRKRRGYDLTPYLPLIVHPGWHAVYSAQKSAPLFEMGDTGARVREDYRQTISDLIIERFFERAADWAHTNGLQARFQAHGAPADLLRAYGVADIPETEDMSGARDQDFLRMARSAADLYGRRLVSAESFATPSKPYTFSLENMKRWSDGLFVAGVNQIWGHGFAYTLPDQAWPNWYPFAASSFSPGFSSMLNEASPQWPAMRALNTYIARVQTVLQNTRNVVPVVIYADFTKADPQAPELGNALRMGGYDYGYINADGILRSKIADGRLVMSGGQSFAAIVLPRVNGLNPEVAEKLAAASRGGVQVIVVGAPPQRAFGLADAKRRDRQVQRAVASMHQTQLDRDKDIANALTKLGVEPNLKFVNGSVADFIEKRDGERRFYFLRNDDPAPRRVSFLTQASGGASLWDPWTGKSEALAVERGDAGAHLSLDLPRYGSALVVFDPATSQLNSAPRTATLVNSKSLGENSWRVHFEGHVLGGATLSEERRLTKLQDWRDLKGLDKFAGAAAYKTTIKLDKSWIADGALSLDLGDAHEAAIVRVNGRALAPLIMRPFAADVTGMLKPGLNDVEITIMNAPQNAMDPKPESSAPSGLLGPVRLLKIK